MRFVVTCTSSPTTIGRHQVRHITVVFDERGIGVHSIGSGNNDTPVKGRGSRPASYNHTSRTLAVTSPRAWLDKPRFVRLNVNATNAESPVPGQDYFVDDALTAGNSSYPYDDQSPVIWSPWVKRG